MATVTKPNLFDFAASELSQDAFVSWLLQWADSSYMGIDLELNDLGKKLLSLMTGIREDAIKQVAVGRQWKNIDVWAEVNDDTFVVIEDKTRTSEHDNQLERYKAAAEDYYAGKRDKFYYIYLKTGNESSLNQKDIISKGYKVITRKMILGVLNTYTGNNNILIDFFNHLQNLEKETNSFKTKTISEWQGHAWEGFYMELEKWYKDLYWGYVPNQSGGFLGAWWNYIVSSIDNVGMYFQVEEGKFSFKIYCHSKERREIRQAFYRTLLKIVPKHNIKVVKPKRFGTGKTMTIGIIDNPFTYYDENRAKSLLNTCCEIIRECVIEFNKETVHLNISMLD